MLAEVILTQGWEWVLAELGARLAPVWGASEGIVGREQHAWVWVSDVGVRFPPAFPFQRLSFCAADASSDKPLVYSVCTCTETHT